MTPTSPHRAKTSFFSEFSLVDTDYLEIENAFVVSPATWSYFTDFFEYCEQAPDYSVPTSVYFDNDQYTLYQCAHQTFRDRLGGIGSHGEIFADVYGLKYRDNRFQQVADELVERHALSVPRVMPGIRVELEERHPHYRNRCLSSLSFADLPFETGCKIARRLGQAEAENLVLSPRFVTTAKRNRFQLSIDPLDARPLQIVPIDELSFSANKRAATQFRANSFSQMNGHHIGIELAMDQLRNFVPPPDLVCGAILNAGHEDFKDFKRIDHDTEPSLLIEMEFKRKYSGADATNDDLIKAYLKVMEFIQSAAELVNDKRFRPIRSKATIGFQLLMNESQDLRRRFGSGITKAACKVG